MAKKQNKISEKTVNKEAAPKAKKPTKKEAVPKINKPLKK
jgi:hypothetical protein